MRVFKISIIYLLFVSLIFTGIFTNANAISAFSFESAIANIATDSEFSIDIEGNNINDLYAAEFELKVDKDKVKITKADTELENVFKTSPIQEENSVYFAYTKVGKSSAENGAIKLCSLTFNALKEGTTNIELKTVKVVHTNLEKEIYEPNKVLSIDVINKESASTNTPSSGITPTATKISTTNTIQATITPTLPTVTTSTPSPTSVSTENGKTSWTGWLIDYDCVGANPYTHTQDCNLMATCIDSGLGIYVYTSGKPYNQYGGEDWIPFDLESQELAAKLDRILSETGNSATHLGKYPNKIPTIKVNGYLVNGGLPSGISDYSKAIHIDSIQFYYIPNVSNYEVTTPENVTLYHNSASSSPTQSNVTITPSGQAITSVTPLVTPVAEATGTPTATVTSVSSDNKTKDEPKKNIPAVVHKDYDNHWAKAYIETLISKGIITGYEDGSIRPDQLISRAEISKILVLSLDYGTNYNGKPAYKDWGKIAEWAKPYVGILSAKGILKGYEDNTVRADKNITRAELVTMTLRSFNIEPSKGKITGPADADKVPGWAEGYVQKGIELGIINGYTDNTLRVSDPIKRGEAFKILVKTLETLNK